MMIMATARLVMRIIHAMKAEITEITAATVGAEVTAAAVEEISSIG